MEFRDLVVHLDTLFNAAMDSAVVKSSAFAFPEGDLGSSARGKVHIVLKQTLQSLIYSWIRM